MAMDIIQGHESGRSTPNNDRFNPHPNNSERPTTPACGPRQTAADGDPTIRDVYTNEVCVSGVETLDKYGECSETARIGARQAERLPRLSLTGSFAFSAADAKTLGDFGARTWSVGPTLVVPIFEGGRLAARVDQAEARAGAAELALRQAVLVAVEETEGALARLQRGRERVRALTDAASAARRAERLADDLFE